MNNFYLFLRGKVFFPLFFLILFQTVSISANAQMRQVYLDNTQTDNHINKLSFYSANEGYVGFDYWVGYTVDSGRTFTKKFITNGNVNFNGNSVNLTFGFGINGVKAFSQNNLLVYGHYGLVPAILRSTDGANTFTLVFHSQYDPLQLRTGITDMVFPQNSTIGYAIDADRVLKTTNQGLNWNVIKNDPGSYFDNLASADDNTVFAYNTSYQTNKFVKTINGGNTWQNVILPVTTQNSINTVYFLNSTTGWLSLTYDNIKSGIYKTINGGTNWVLQNDVDIAPFACSKIKFIDANIGFATTGLFEVYKTFNGGAIWEPLPRSNNYTYLGYSHNDLQIVSSNQLWAGGGHGFLEINTNAGGNPLPKAYFKIDTSGVANTRIVNLVNYSRTGYTYKWFVNNVQISTNYNTSYTHNINRLADTVKLVVSNGVSSDTTIKSANFQPPLSITSFTPTIGTLNTLVTITGTNLNTVQNVYFGGVAAALYNIISPTQINAYTNNGATGNVTVTNGQFQASLPGFTYYAPVSQNINYSISDTIICKSKSVTITILNAQPNVRYDLIDSLYNYYGFIDGGGNGGDLSFQTIPITNTRRYQVIGRHMNISGSNTGFSTRKTILVEQTKSIISADKENIVANERVGFTNQSITASTYLWTFNQDANTTSSTSPNPQNISYLTAGQKTLSLVSTSINGCKDTLATNAVFVYTKPSADDICYAQNVDDSDYYYQYGPWEQANKILLASDNGYYVSGFGTNPILKSRYGNNKTIPLVENVGAGYLAKYTTNGVLSWYTNIKSYGAFDAVEKDANGNIYIVGNCGVDKFLRLPNGDTLRIAATASDLLIPYSNSKTNAFILKLDSLGRYLWHTILADPNDVYGLEPNLSFKIKIKIKGNQVLVAGNFGNKLSYSRNGVIQPLINLNDSIPVNLFPNSRNHFFINLKPDGTLTWFTYFMVNSTNQIQQITALDIDNNNNVYLSGLFEEALLIHDVGNVNNILYNFAGTGNGSTNSYLLKFDSTGRLNWHVKAVNPFYFRDIAFKNFVVDDAGNAYITGSTAIFNNTQYFTLTNSNGTNINIAFSPYFLIKLNTQGMYSWAVGNRILAGSGFGGYSVLLKNNSIYTTGAINYTSAIPSKSVITSTDGNNICDTVLKGEFFVAKYDTSGKLKRFNRSGKNESYNFEIKNLIFDNNSNLLIEGKTNSYNAPYQPLSIFNQTLPYNGNDIFFAKLDSNYCSSSTSPIADAGPDKTICNNQSVSIGVPPITGNHYYWYSNPVGFESIVANPDVLPTVATTYYLNVINASGLIKTDSVYVTLNTSTVANAGDDITLFEGGSVQIGTPPQGGVQYLWTGPNGFTSILANPIITPAVSGIYVMKQLAGTCVSSDSIMVNVLTQTPLIVCPTTGAYTLASSNTGTTYQWQLNTGTDTYSNIANNSNYSGTQAQLLTLTQLPSSFYGYKYRSVVDGINGPARALKFQNNWIGGSGNNFWSNPLNWSCGVVPDGNVDVNILSGTVLLNSNGICRSIYVGSGATFTASPGFMLTITH